MFDPENCVMGISKYIKEENQTSVCEFNNVFSSIGTVVSNNSYHLSITKLLKEQHHWKIYHNSTYQARNYWHELTGYTLSRDFQPNHMWLQFYSDEEKILPNVLLTKSVNKSTKFEAYRSAYNQKFKFINEKTNIEVELIDFGITVLKQ